MPTFPPPTTGPRPPRVDNAPLIIPNWQPVQSPISVASRQTLAKTPDTFERQLNVSALNEPCRVTLGRDRLGAQILTAVLNGSSLLVVAHWGRGPIEQVESFTVNNATSASVIATHYTGTSSQTVDSKLVTAFAALGITHSDAMLGHAYSVLEFPVGTDLGDIHAIIKGVKAYDPRNGTHVLATPSTWTYTDNPALLLAHVITNTTYGLGASFDWSGSTAAFDACDDMTPGEKKRLVGLTMDRRMAAHEWCEVLRAHAGCFIVRSAGLYKLVPDIAGSSVRTFAKNDIIKGSLRWARAGLSEQPNVVEVTYTDNSVIPWKTATAVYPANGIPPVGEELRLTRLNLAGVQWYSQAMREVHERRGHGRLEALSFSFDTFAEAIAQEPGDICTLNDGGMFGGVLFRLLTKSMRRPGRWTITGKKYDPAVYNNSADAAPTYGDTTLPLPTSPPTVGAVTLTEEVVTVPTGALPLSRIRGAWTALSTYPFFAGYRVIVTDPAGVVVDTQDVSSAVYVSPPLNAFTTYTVNVYARSSVAVSATPSTGTITLTSTGTGALAAVWSQTIAATGWTYANAESFKLWEGDPYLRVRTLASAEPTESTVYPGANQSTPGKASQLLDAAKATFASPPGLPTATSPIFDIGVSRAAVIALTNIAKWISLYQGSGASDGTIGTSGYTRVAVSFYVYQNDSPTLTGAVAVLGYQASGSGRYCRFEIKSTQSGAGGGFVIGRLWQVEFDQASIAALMPTVTDTVSATSSASGGVTVSLPRKYITVTGVQITSQSTTQANPSYSNLTLSETVLADNTLQLHCYDASNARIAVPCSIQITGVEAL